MPLTYKGYTATVEFDPDAKILHGEVQGLRDVIVFTATCVEDVAVEFQRSVDEYLALCRARGEAPERAYSGHFMVRVSPVLHRACAEAARLSGLSLNTYVMHLLQCRLDGVLRHGVPIPATTASSRPMPYSYTLAREAPRADA